MKYLKLLVCSLTLTSALTLSGCFYQTTNDWDIQNAMELCGDLSSVQEIESDFTGNEVVTCKNSKRFALHK